MYIYVKISGSLFSLREKICIARVCFPKSSRIVDCYTYVPLPAWIPQNQESPPMYSAKYLFILASFSIGMLSWINLSLKQAFFISLIHVLYALNLVKQKCIFYIKYSQRKKKNVLLSRLNRYYHFFLVTL